MLAITRRMAGVLVAIPLVVICSDSARAQQNSDLQHDATSILASPPAVNPSDLNRPALERRGTRYQLCASDVIAVTFPMTPEFNQTVNIQPDGFASYGTESNRGFLALIAQPGMGKTSLLFQYLEYLRNRTRTAYIFHTDRDSRDFLRYLLTDLGVDTSGKDIAAMHAALNQILVEEMRVGRGFILVIDEAQNLREHVLESVRLLSNFETPWTKLIQIVLAGQPQLAERLARPSMAQLRQRISSVIRLEPFTQEEIGAYINHRLWVAGYHGPDLFTPGARIAIGQYTGGIPRRINTLCFNAMSIGYAMDAKKIDAKIVEEAASDLEIESLIPVPQKPRQAPARPQPRAPFSSILPPQKTAHPWRVAAQVVALAAVVLLGVASGLSWKLGMRTPPLDLAFSSRAASAQQNPRPALNPVAGTDDLARNLPREKHESGMIRTIIVEKQNTLRHLSLEYLNRFDSKTIDEIRALNPAIIDPDHIDAGQQLRLPIRFRPKESSEAEFGSRLAPTASQEVNR
jgi:type II secretory pathway predicted ATPase ExeA